MSLPRNIQDHSGNTTPQEELSSLWQKVMSLRAEERQSAEDKYQTALLLTTVDKLCGVLTDFMNDTQSELKKMNENQLRLLNIQEEYRTNVRKDAAKVLNDNYIKIVNHQNESFDKMMEHMKTAVSEMETAVDKSSEKLFRASHTSGLVGLWYSLAPLAVIVQAVVILWQHFR